MAQLMVVPIKDRGDAVLMIGRYRDNIVIGFVLQKTLVEYWCSAAPILECVSFVERHVPDFEEAIHRISRVTITDSDLIPCVEVTLAELNGMQARGETCDSKRCDHRPSG